MMRFLFGASIVAVILLALLWIPIDYLKRQVARPRMKAVYVAHPLGGGADREMNRQNAAAWCGMLAQRFRCATVADWIVLSGEWSEENGRALGLEIDVELVSRCDELWLVGGRVSPGMRIEARKALALGIPVRDLTHLGYVAPETWFALPEPIASL